MIILLFVKIIKDEIFGEESWHLLNKTITKFHTPKSYHLLNIALQILTLMDKLCMKKSVLNSIGLTLSGQKI